MFRSISRRALHRPLATATETAPTNVLKFGGSSVGNADAIRSCAEIMLQKHSSGVGTVAVLSAMYGVTNKLHSLLDAARQGDVRRMQEVRDVLARKHMRTADELLGGSGGGHATLLKETQQRVDHILTDTVDAAASAIVRNDGQALPWHVDTVVSAGERLSVPLLAAYLNSLSSNTSSPSAVAVDAADVVVSDRNTGLHTAATTDAVRHSLLPLVQRGNLVLMTGYLAADAGDTGKVCTLGRGGSDLSATVVGRGMAAERVELYKVECHADEDGFMIDWKDDQEQRRWTGVLSADPRLCSDSRVVARLNFSEATELSRFGKKVLHPDTMSPLRRTTTAIHVKNTMLPRLPGTLITDDASVLQPASTSAVAVASLPVQQFASLNPSASAAVAHCPADTVIAGLVGHDIARGGTLADQLRDVVARLGLPLVAADDTTGHSVAVAVRPASLPNVVNSLHSALSVSTSAKL